MSLPSGYTRLEYIESTGTQYIDTGFIPNQDTRIDMVACPTSVVDASGGAGFVPYGSAQSYNSRTFECYTVSAQYEFNYGTTYKSIGNAAIGQKVAITHNKNNVSLSINDGPLLTTSFIYSSFTTPYTMTLFGTHRSSVLCGQQKIYSCQIRDNGHLIRNFIPCKNTNGVVGLWDDVNSQFYQNVGTGSFIAGEMPKGTHKTLVNGTAYEVQGGKCLVNGTSYDIKKGRTLIGGTGYDITFAPSYDPVFANNTWEQIIKACHNNEVLDTWKVADHKPMTINGVDYQIDIIGKNHDYYSDGSGKAPLTFQAHDCYGELKRMNIYNTINGGWAPCDMRSTHLPAILALMPAAVQSGIREVNKLTSADSPSATINTTADRLFLLSEIEIFGSVICSKSGEGTQYDYYKAGNSKVKKYNGGVRYWWERSPFYGDSTYFCFVSSRGDASYDVAAAEQGVAFAFCF